MKVKGMSISRRAVVAAAAVAITAALAPASALAATSNDQTQFSVTGGSLSFSSAPALPTLTAHHFERTGADDQHDDDELHGPRRDGVAAPDGT